MSLFKIIANLISEEPKKRDVEDQLKKIPYSNEGNGVKSETIIDNTSQQQDSSMPVSGIQSVIPPIETKEEILKIVLELFNKLSGHLEMDVPQNLVIWLDTDILTFQTYDTNQNRERLMEILLNECDVKFENIAFCIGKPSEELHCTTIGNSGKAYLQIKESRVEEQANPQKASISIFCNAGSLLKDKYILSSIEMKEKNISAYNIGAGEFPKIPFGYRQNHIAIDDNPQSPMIEKNKYVSRMHAHIGYSNNFGFYLQVERDGTRLMGKRTRIFRGEQIIEMDNTAVKEPLQDGDLIELGKAVRLHYVELTD